LSLSSALHIFHWAEPADLRKSIDSLSALVRMALGDEPHSRHWFVFRNRKDERLKIPAWEEDGWCVW
jgi:transposase